MAGKSYKERNDESIAKYGKSLYTRRIEAAQAKGFSRSQARGHARAFEAKPIEIKHAQKPLLPPSQFKPGMKTTDRKIFSGKAGKVARDEMNEAIDDYRSSGDYDEDSVYVEFEADFDIDGYDLGRRTIYATFSGQEARDFLNKPTLTSVIDRYASGGGGFSSQQWASGTSNISDFTIHPA